MSLVPSSIQDETTLMLEECLVEAIENIDLSKIIVSIPELAPENILSFLAEQSHVLGREGWNASKTKAEKIGLLNSAIELHRKKGTVGAVAKCLEISDVDAKLSRWFEYDGIPHHYKLIFDLINQKLSTEILNSIYEKVEEYKQLRAKLDGFELNYTSLGKTKLTPMLRSEVVKLSLPLEVINE